MANYIGLPLEKVRRATIAKDYELIITDSIHLIGKPGGYVLNQVPKPNSFVKRGRKVYITVSRYKADIVLSDNIPTLYGEKFEFKKQEFESLLQLKLVCSGTKYDPGPTGHILEARYKGQLLADEKIRTLGLTLEKGDSIQVIISVNEGGEMDVPNLRCKTLAEAKFELEAASLSIGLIETEGQIDNPNDAYIIFQNPAFEKGRKIKMNSSIQVKLSQTFPNDCEPQ